jgi:hypothetical protein
MSYQSDIYDAIAAAPEVAALIAARIYPDVAPGNAATPYAVYQVISSHGTTTHDGARAIIHPLIQVSCWAASRPAAATLAAKIRAAIEGFQLPGTSEAFLTFSNETGDRDQETGLFGEVLEFRASCKINQ